MVWAHFRLGGLVDWIAYLWWGLAPAGVTVALFLWWLGELRENRGKVGPVGHIHAMQLVFCVFAPSAFAWLLWLLVGLLSWLQS